MAATFEFRDENDVSLSGIARLDTMVTVVDAANLLANYSSHDFLRDRGESPVPSCSRIAFCFSGFRGVNLANRPAKRPRCAAPKLQVGYFVARKLSFSNSAIPRLDTGITKHCGFGIRCCIYPNREKDRFVLRI